MLSKLSPRSPSRLSCWRQSVKESTGSAHCHRFHHQDDNDKCAKNLTIRVALATVVAAYAAEVGFEVSEELVLTILGVGAALILGIAHEDHARKAATHRAGSGD